MSSLPTPGPWSFTKHGDTKGWTVSKGNSIASVRPQRGDGEAEANARLIAAAPELLAALIDAAEVLGNEVAASCNLCGGEGGWDERTLQPRMTPVRHREGCVYANARAAIAKAEGR
jgi:hypothetical protein